MNFDFLVDPITWVNYVPAAGYLAVVTLLAVLRRPWHPVHLAGLIIGVGFQTIMHGPLALLSVVGCLPILMVFIWALSKTISATGIFSVCVTLAILPLNGWHAVGLGLLLALMVSLARTSLARTRFIGTNAMISMGVTPAGIMLPSLDYMPQRSAEGNGKTTRLPPYLLAGVVGAAALEWLLLR